ncbi:MAG TPA: hypothetical protein ENF21_10745 [Bacteroidetes bacterium]|nr:hypothetical protein [Bacteroidota bacterium]
MKRALFPLIFLALITSCKTSSLMIDVLRPADINLPGDIRTLAVVNRSLPSKEAEVNNLVEGIITGEGLLADRLGSRACVTGFADALQSSPRFRVVVPDIELEGTGTDRMPPLLEWPVIDDICRQNGADALLSLETFDSNTGGVLFSILNQTPGQNLTIKVESGWRIYDPERKQLLDENIYIDHLNWDAPISGAGQSRQEVVERGGYYAGTQYAARISPSWGSVSRIFFKKGNRDFREAKRLVRMGMLDEAARLWETYIDHPNRKIAGYACYNMALISELRNDLEGALQWATRSYRQYRIRKAAEYMSILNYRIMQADVLDQQLME